MKQLILKNKSFKNIQEKKLEASKNLRFCLMRPRSLRVARPFWKSSSYSPKSVLCQRNMMRLKKVCLNSEFCCIFECKYSTRSMNSCYDEVKSYT